MSNVRNAHIEERLRDNTTCNLLTFAETAENFLHYFLTSYLEGHPDGIYLSS